MKEEKEDKILNLSAELEKAKPYLDKFEKHSSANIVFYNNNIYI